MKFNFEEYNEDFQEAVTERGNKELIAIETVTEDGKEKNIVDIAGVKIESYASKEELEELIKEIHPTAEGVEILQAMALTFQQKRGLIVEGETSRSKTFLMNKFTQLRFGKETMPVDFYCNGQTDTISLMAKWVPNTDNSEDEVLWDRYVNSPEGKKEMNSIIQNVENGSEEIDNEDIQKQFFDLAKKAGIESQVKQWKFQYGALPRAMTMPEDPSKPVSEENPSRGMFMHVQEVGLAETQVIDALLQLGGEKGKLAKNIQLWDDGGRKVEAGPDFWIYYSTNPPETYAKRSGIDQALSRRNTYLRLSEKEDPISIDIKNNRDNDIPYEYFSEDLKGKIKAEEKNVILPIEKGGDYNSPEYIPVRCLVTEVVSDFHKKMLLAMSEKEIEQRTKQKFALTDDHWNMVYDFMRTFTSPDLEATLDKAVYLHYISCFGDDGKEKAWEMWRKIKDMKDFKEELEKALPEKVVIKEMENLGRISEFQKTEEENLRKLEEELGDFCPEGEKADSDASVA